MIEIKGSIKMIMWRRRTNYLNKYMNFPISKTSVGAILEFHYSTYFARKMVFKIVISSRDIDFLKKFPILTFFCKKVPDSSSVL